MQSLVGPAKYILKTLSVSTPESTPENNKRVTIFPKDLQLARRIRGERA
jgi:histone H3/H4